MTDLPQTPITLPVNNLEAATSFYLSTLEPLGYKFISRLQHQNGNSASAAVGLGPSNTTRVDLFLTQADTSAERTRHRKCPHVVFPAISRVAVTDFYNAALKAGGRPIASPEIKQRGHRAFAATIQDIDGNKVEVVSSDAVESDAHDPGVAMTRASAPPPARRSINNGRERVVDGRPPPNYRSTSARRERIPEPTPAPISRGRRSSVGSDKRTPPAKASTRDGSTSKSVVGTLLGAAAGAAVVYAFTKESSDSKAKDPAPNPRTQGRDRLTTEARGRAYALAWREKAVKSRRDRGNPIDRDSGYYSAASSQRREQSADRDMPRYPQPRRRSSFDDRSSRASSSRTLKGSGDPARTAASPTRSNNSSAAPRRSTSHRHGPPSHISVSHPPSELRRPSPPYIPRDRDRDRARDPQPQRRSSPSTTTTTYRLRRHTPPPPEREPRAPDHYADSELGDGLDDATVVPDDSISVISFSAPSHRVDPRLGRRGVA